MGYLKIVVMGVSGSGKSLIGERLAQHLGIPFFDADDFHSEANVKKMASGKPLSDADRVSWLADLAKLIEREPALVLGCSALKQCYRQRFREAATDLVFLYMDGDFDTIASRLSKREGHYFSGEKMLRNQFEQLEPPGLGEAVPIDIRMDEEGVLRQCLAALSQ
ncbi:gluconokinase [Halomonas sp. ML-15]|uniref:gluconokinase n=1 Tax=Halomonas sp. ML-15 TaxID=2773305 RepID=UPI001746EBFE|nr:gluconokinase [Halomonas sp. ML-15]MBD3897540.1 gluconokinase [Halomonas sp. ML-15]